MSFRLSVNLALILKNIDSNNCTLILFGRKRDRLCFFCFFLKKADGQVGQIFTGKKKKKDDGGKEREKKIT